MSAYLAAACTASSPHSKQPVATVAPESPRVVGGIALERAPAVVADQCQRAANAVGYPVPCPRLLPFDGYPTPIAGPFANSKKAHELFSTGFGSFRKFAFGDMTFPAAGTALALPFTSEGHLVISASPPGTDLRHLLYGPAARPDDPLVFEGTAKVLGTRGEFVRVLSTNSDSIFQGHLVLTWSSGGHYYAVGFHRVNAASRALDLVVARNVVLVPPTK